MPWAYFDGASDINGRCGAGLIIHLSEEKIVKASVGLGQGSNNFVVTSFSVGLSLGMWESRFLGIQWTLWNGLMGLNNAETSSCFLCSKKLYALNVVSRSFLCAISTGKGILKLICLSKDGVDQDPGSWTVLEEENGVIRPLEQPIFAEDFVLTENCCVFCT